MAEAGLQLPKAPFLDEHSAPFVQASVQASSGRNVSISTDRWLTHLPTIAKCNIFNGQNLILWERTIQAALKPRKLIHHLQENCPTEDDPNYQRWVMEEEFVFAWLLDSISPEYMASFISYDTAKGLWEAIRRSYSKKGNKAKIIDLISRSYNLKQGEKDILTYSNELRTIHAELDHCYQQSSDPTARTREATNRLCQLLQGLRLDFETVRSQLYNRDEEPTFDEAVSKLIQEESRLQALKGEVEGSAYITKGFKYSGQNQSQYPRNGTKTEMDRGGKSDLVCSYCKKIGHHKDKCWQLHGRPPHLAKAHALQSSYKGAGPNATSEIMPTAQDFQKMLQEIQHLKTVLNSSTSVIGSTSMANSGKNQILSSLTFFTKNLTAAWILDSGATDHMTPLSHNFTSYEPVAPGKYVQTADGTLLPVIGIGAINLQPIGLINRVLHVPKQFESLVSVQRLAKLKNYSILFDDLDAYLCSKVQGSRIGLAKIKQGLYYLPGLDSQSPGAGDLKMALIQVSTTPMEPVMELHNRMGHPSFHLLKQMYPHMFKDIKFELLTYDACQLGKFKRNIYPPNNNRTNKAFQILHCDVWGPSPYIDLLGHQYFLIYTDDHSRFTWLFLLKHKSEVSNCIKNLYQLIKRQFGDAVQGLRTDNAKDFLNNNLNQFLTSEGIRHETSCRYTPQQNGLAERKIGDIVDKARTLLIHAHAPMNLWGFSIMTAVHLINRLPSKTLGLLSPITILENLYPNIKLQTGLPNRVFGCVAYVHNPTHKHNKWSHKALKCVFLGYSTTQKGYKVYHPITRKHLVSKDVVFDENTPFYMSANKATLRDLPYLQLLDTSISTSTHSTNNSNTVKDSTPHEDSSSHEICQSPLPELNDGISPSSDGYPTAS